MNLTPLEWSLIAGAVTIGTLDLMMWRLYKKLENLNRRLKHVQEQVVTARYVDHTRHGEPFATAREIISDPNRYIPVTETGRVIQDIQLTMAEFQQAVNNLIDEINKKKEAK